MDAETVKSEFVSVENGNKVHSSLLHEKEDGTVTGLTEPITFGSHGPKEPVDREGNNRPVAHLKDVVDEWPTAPQIHSFFIVKYRSYDDPKLKAKLELADKDLQKKTQARSQILEKLKAKRSDRAQLLAQMRPLNDENRQFWSVVDEKKKEMEPLQQALGKLRTNNANREKGVAICSSEEELNSLIKSLQYRVQHETIPLSEEKQILREINQLERTREEVLANAAMRAKIQESLGKKEALQDQVKLIGVDLDGVRKEQQVIKAKLKQLTDEKLAIEKEIKSLEAELTAATEKREKAYEDFQGLRKQREEGNSCFFQNRMLLTKAKDFAARKDIEALKEIINLEAEEFMSMWNKSKPFRDDYERRISSSLDYRQLSRDGRIRNPDEKPLVLQESSTSSKPETVSKPKTKQPKEDSTSASQKDNIPVEKSQKEPKTKPSKEVKNRLTEPIDLDDKGKIMEAGKLKEDSKIENEADEAKLKEIRREEEIAKAKQALERKKKLAEKAAVKAAVKAQKEAEKKLKEREKKLKKKASALGLVAEPEEHPTEADAEVAEPETSEENIEAPILSKMKDQRGNVIRHRTTTRSKGPDSLSRVILKRKKSTNYWVWAAPAALSAMMVLVIGYKYLL